MRRVLVVLALVLIPAAAARSTTAFRLRYPLTWQASSLNLNWVSLPYFFYPNGNVGQTPQNSLDLCLYFNGATGRTSPIAKVGRWETTLSRMRWQPCISPIKAFDLEVGRGYAVTPDAAGRTIDLIGSHDDLYAPNKTPVPSAIPLVHDPAATNLNWISLPYNLKANNSLDLCVEANAGSPPRDVESISALRNDLWSTQDCASPTKAFDLYPGESYAYVPARAGVAVNFEVYGCGNTGAHAVASGNDVVLHFSTPPTFTQYDIYRVPQKASGCSTLLGTTSTSPFVDLGARSNPSPIDFYDVRGR